MFYTSNNNYINISNNRIFTTYSSGRLTYGIRLAGYNCVISENTISTGYSGIYLSSANNITISRNTIQTSNSGHVLAFGIKLEGTNSIISENILNTSDTGIWITSSEDSIIFGNHITGNMIGDGVKLENLCVGNIIFENNITNKNNGIYISYDGCNNNII